MKTKKLYATLLLTIFAIAILACIFSVFVAKETITANAEETTETPIVGENTDDTNVPETPTIIIENEKEEESLAEVFKNDILPFVVSAGSSIIAFLIALFPWLKTKTKFSSLQGLYSAEKKTNEKLNAKLAEFNTDNFVNAIKDKVVKNLEVFITDTITDIVKQHKIDNSEEIAVIATHLEQLGAQVTNLISAAQITWKNVDGVDGILAKSPTAEVLKGYYEKYVELQKKFNELQAKETVELNNIVDELSIYSEVNNANK